MKKCVLLLIPLLLLLTACARPADQSHTTAEYSYAENLTTPEEVMRCSTNIVRAKLVSMDDFDGATQVYLFRVADDLIGNTPGEIHVYDAYDPAYIPGLTPGGTYYIFLQKTNGAHTLFSRVFPAVDAQTVTPTAPGLS